MKLHQALEEKQLDVRLRDRLLAEGKISKDTVEKYLKTLTDDEKNMMVLEERDLRKNQ